MKAILAILLISLIGLSTQIQIPILRNSTKIEKCVEAFLDTLGLDALDDFAIKVHTDIIQIRALIKQVLKDWEKSSRSWADTADSIAKVGEIVEVFATTIRDNANNTQLVKQIHQISTYVDYIKKNPVNFYNKVKQNIDTNYMQIVWAVMDLKNVYKRGDFVELGRRFANLLQDIFKDATKPPTGLRFLADRAAPKKNVRFLDCFKKIFALTKELIEVITKSVKVNMQEVMRIVNEIYQVYTECHA